MMSIGSRLNSLQPNAITWCAPLKKSNCTSGYVDTARWSGLDFPLKHIFFSVLLGDSTDKFF